MASCYSESEIEKAISKAAEDLGYSQLRPQQRKAVKLFIKGRDVFVNLPMGSGKSLCYWLLPKTFDYLRREVTQSVAVIVSPLIALMKDQVRAMTQRNVSAVYAGEAEGETERDICCAKYQLVYLSPEALLNDSRWRDMLLGPVYQERLVALVIDEAHCVKKWGETFRRAFSQLGEVRSLIPERVRMMALTATATKTTRVAVCRTLGLVDPAVVQQMPNRQNIKYIVHTNPGTLQEEFAPLVEKIRLERTRMDKMIIYCRTYDSCASVYLYFRSRLGPERTEPIGAVDLAPFRLVDMFCGCTTTTVKESILQSFCTPDAVLRVVVATIAFGMGIDNPNVRTIIHWGPSENVEQYLQETGRAGRDGRPAKAILYATGVKGLQVEEAMTKYSKNKYKCRRQLLLADFDDNLCQETASTLSECQCCDVCALTCMCILCSQ